MMHIAYSPISAKFINFSSILVQLTFFLNLRFFLPPILTMMHHALHILGTPVSSVLIPEYSIKCNVPSKLCVCACAHTSHEMCTHKKTWSAHKCSFQKCFCTYFIHGVPNTNDFW